VGHGGIINKPRVSGLGLIDFFFSFSPFSLLPLDMESIHKESGRIRKRNLQPQFLQRRIPAQKLKIIKPISPSGKDRDI
jgi:hypothetical protein